LRGIVTQVVTGPVNSEVKIQLSGGRRLTATVTNNSLNEFDLVEGIRCCALVKASQVLITLND
jgi:molybdate transport system regulatory protein